MTQTLHEIVMQLNEAEGLSPDALWGLKQIAEMKGDELTAANQRIAELEAALRTMAQSWLDLAKAFEGPATPYCDGKAESLKLCASDLARIFDAVMADGAL